MAEATLIHVDTYSNVRQCGRVVCTVWGIRREMGFWWERSWTGGGQGNQKGRRVYWDGGSSTFGLGDVGHML